MADNNNYTPETPGAEVEFTKPKIPDCWEPQPVIDKSTT